MLETTTIQLAVAKYATITLLPVSLMLTSGIIAWRMWKKYQLQSQAETDGMKDEIRDIKKQLSDLQKVNSRNQSDPTESTSQQQKRKKSTDKDQDNTGLFEYLINDNIKLRNQT